VFLGKKVATKEMKSVVIRLPDGKQFSTLVTSEYTFRQLAVDGARFWGFDAADVAIDNYPEDEAVLKFLPSSGDSTLDGLMLVAKERASNSRRRRRASTPLRDGAPSPFLPSRSRSSSFINRNGSFGSLGALSRNGSFGSLFEPLHLGSISPVGGGGIDDAELESPKDLDEEMWNVFMSYSYVGTDSGGLTARQFQKLLKDCNLISSTAGAVDGAQSRLLFTKWAKKGHMSYDNMLNCLVELALRLWPKLGSPQEAFMTLLTQHLLLYAVRFNWLPEHPDWDTQTELLHDPEVTGLLVEFQDALQLVLEAFIDPTRAIKRAKENAGTNSSNGNAGGAVALPSPGTTGADRQLWLSWREFKSLATFFKLGNSNLGLSLQELHHLFGGCAGWKGGMGPLFGAFGASVEQLFDKGGLDEGPLKPRPPVLDSEDRSRLYFHGLLELLARVALLGFLPDLRMMQATSSSGVKHIQQLNCNTLLMQMQMQLQLQTLHPSGKRGSGMFVMVRLMVKCMLQHIHLCLGLRAKREPVAQRVHAPGHMHADGPKVMAATRLFEQRYKQMWGDDGCTDYQQDLRTMIVSLLPHDYTLAGGENGYASRTKKKKKKTMNKNGAIHKPVPKNGVNGPGTRCTPPIHSSCTLLSYTPLIPPSYALSRSRRKGVCRLLRPVHPSVAVARRPSQPRILRRITPRILPPRVFCEPCEERSAGRFVRQRVIIDFGLIGRLAAHTR
jgi:hypothetical protein